MACPNITISGVLETVLASLLSAGLLKFFSNVFATLLTTYGIQKAMEQDKFGWLYAVCHYNALTLMYRERKFLKELKHKLKCVKLRKVNHDGTDVEDVDDAEVYPGKNMLLRWHFRQSSLLLSLYYLPPCWPRKYGRRIMFDQMFPRFTCLWRKSAIQVHL